MSIAWPLPASMLPRGSCRLYAAARGADAAVPVSPRRDVRLLCGAIARADHRQRGGQTTRRQAFSAVLPVVDPSEPCAIRGLDRDDGGCGQDSLSIIGGAALIPKSAASHR